MEPLLFVFRVTFAINLIVAAGIVFVERRSPEIALAWVAILVFAPIFGFLLYVFLGQNFYRNRLFRLKTEDDRKLQEEVGEQLRKISAMEEAEKDERIRRYMGTMQMLLRSNNAIITDGNVVEIYTTG
ncbi:MAG: PLDc N-terminal domain-containing protein, partial [Methanomicrobiales archaeon]|nr:PLDc N-terminal domain-containing protein [Methanomicrobiales archaeon]